MSGSAVQIDASKINFNGLVTANNYFKINTDGSMEVRRGTIGGWIIDSTSIYSRFYSTELRLHTPDTDTGGKALSVYDRISGKFDFILDANGVATWEGSIYRTIIDPLEGFVIKNVKNTDCRATILAHSIKIKTLDGGTPYESEFTGTNIIAGKDIILGTNNSALYGTTAAGNRVPILQFDGSNNIVIGQNYINYNNNINLYTYAGQINLHYGSTIGLSVRKDTTGIHVLSLPTYNRTSTSSANMYVSSSGVFCRSSSSSKRYKHSIEDIQPFEYQKIFDLPVSTFVYKTKAECPEGGLSPGDYLYNKRIPGFIAEKVEEHIPLAAEYNDKGEIEMFNQKILFPMVVAGVQDNHREIKKLKAEVARLGDQLLSAQMQIMNLAGQIEIIKA